MENKEELQIETDPEDLDDINDVPNVINVSLTPQAKRAMYRLKRYSGESYRTIMRKSLLQRARLVNVATYPTSEILPQIKDIVKKQMESMEQFFTETFGEKNMEQVLESLGFDDEGVQQILSILSRSDRQESGQESDDNVGDDDE